MKSYFLFILLATTFSFSFINAQDMTTALPYAEIESYPNNYEPGNIIKRTIDGLGYRYYWATDSLRMEDLNYKPSDTSRPVIETLEHLHGLSKTIVNCARGEANIRGVEQDSLDWETLRKSTLENFHEAAELFSKMDAEQVESSKIIFQRGDNKAEYDFWHMLNGPIADAIYHVGQIVSHRRASGNPLYGGVNVFMGKNRF